MSTPDHADHARTDTVARRALCDRGAPWLAWWRIVWPEQWRASLGQAKRGLGMESQVSGQSRAKAPRFTTIASPQPEPSANDKGKFCLVWAVTVT